MRERQTDRPTDRQTGATIEKEMKKGRETEEDRGR